MTSMVDAIDHMEAFLRSVSTLSSHSIQPSWKATGASPEIVLVPVGMGYEHDDTDVGRPIPPPWRSADINIMVQTAAGAIGGEQEGLEIIHLVEQALIDDPTCGDRFSEGVLLRNMNIDDEEAELDQDREQPAIVLRVSARLGRPRS